jgi:pimeloyl-ACP methyl ester carboxylesterase
MSVERSDPTIVLVHGLWLTPRSWEGWKGRFESSGHQVLAPAWPRMQGEVEDIRRDPSPLNGLGVREITDHYAEIVRGLDRPPIIMGHSFGGLVTELLLDRGLGAAGVAVSPAPIKGVLRLPLAQLRSALPALRNPANRNRTVELTPKQFHYAFTNAQDEAVSQHAYDRYSAPTPAKVLFQGGFAAVTPHAATTFNFADDDRAPLLFISGGSDHILPPVVQDHNYKKSAKHSTAIAAHTVFPGRDHYTCGEPGWEAVADFALDWALAPVSGELAP